MRCGLVLSNCRRRTLLPRRCPGLTAASTGAGTRPRLRRATSRRVL